jgi:DnaK suppressor protein
VKTVPDANAGLSPEFIKRQRRRLIALRRRLLGLERAAEAHDRELQEEYADRTLDNGEDYSNIREREIVDGLIDVGGRRLRDVERALRKIKEGSYGVSDASGQPIPIARLEIVPEAIETVEEAARGEAP